MYASHQGNERTCAVCGTVMDVFDVQGVELDWCPFCSAVFFDRGELQQVSRRRRAALLLRDVDDRPCPGCKEEMRRGRVGQWPVSVCRGCFGVFVEGDTALAMVAEVAPEGERELKLAVAANRSDGIQELDVEEEPLPGSPEWHVRREVKARSIAAKVVEILFHVLSGLLTAL